MKHSPLLLSFLLFSACDAKEVAQSAAEAIAAPQISEATRQNAVVQMGNIHQSLAIYKVTSGQKYPLSLEEAKMHFPEAVVPKDPFGNDFIYFQEDGGRSYRLVSLGEDGMEGGSGSAADLVFQDGALLP